MASARRRWRSRRPRASWTTTRTARLYLDLRGHDTRAPLTALRGLTFLIGALGGDAGEVPDDVDQAAAIFRSLVSGSRLLIVLDNAADAAQVEPMLPASPGCAVVITSRRSLAGIVDAHHVPLDVLPVHESRRLLGRLVGDERLAQDPRAAAEPGARLRRPSAGAAHRRLAARGPPHLAPRLPGLPLTEARTCLSEPVHW